MDLQKKAKDTPTAYLICRSLLGHSWDENKGTVDIVNLTYFWSVPCSRCTTVRTLKIGSHGVRKGNSYKWPEGYNLECGQLTKADLELLRGIALRRLLSGT
jgi:hypothetical protein